MLYESPGAAITKYRRPGGLNMEIACLRPECSPGQHSEIKCGGDWFFLRKHAFHASPRLLWSAGSVWHC